MVGSLQEHPSSTSMGSYKSIAGSSTLLMALGWFLIFLNFHSIELRQALVFDYGQMGWSMLDAIVKIYMYFKILFWFDLSRYIHRIFNHPLFETCMPCRVLRSRSYIDASISLVCLVQGKFILSFFCTQGSVRTPASYPFDGYDRKIKRK